MTLEDASDVVNEIEAMGLTSFMTGMDNVRNLTGSPIAGLDPHELMDVRPMLVELQVSPSPTSRITVTALHMVYHSPCLSVLLQAAL